jgi:hypothetical protein
MRGVLWFLLICFGLAWIWWELIIQSGIGVLSWQFQLYGLPAAFSPAVAAYVVGNGSQAKGSVMRPSPKPAALALLSARMAVTLGPRGDDAQAVLFGIAEPDLLWPEPQRLGWPDAAPLLGEQAGSSSAAAGRCAHPPSSREKNLAGAVICSRGYFLAGLSWPRWLQASFGRLALSCHAARL